MVEVIKCFVVITDYASNLQNLIVTEMGIIMMAAVMIMIVVIYNDDDDYGMY